MLPAVIMGSFLGVYLSAIMPDIVITGILTLLLVFLTFQAAIKARQIYQKENRALEKIREEEEAGRL